MPLAPMAKVATSIKSVSNSSMPLFLLAGALGAALAFPPAAGAFLSFAGAAFFVSKTGFEKWKSRRVTLSCWV